MWLNQVKLPAVLLLVLAALGFGLGVFARPRAQKPPAPPEAKATVNLMDVLLAYTEFDRPYAAPPGVPKERLQILRESFERVLKDPEFAAEAKKLLDWDGTTYLSGEQLQKKIDPTVTQPRDVIRRVKEILEES